MSAACATAAAKEECRVIVLETQELARKLTRSDLKKMADTFAQQEQACISTSGSPLSMFAPETWSKCFLDFFYGDAVPNMPQRGLKGNHTTYVPMEDIFAWLQDREELEYTLPAERSAGQPTPPYKASEPRNKRLPTDKQRACQELKNLLQQKRLLLAEINGE